MRQFGLIGYPLSHSFSKQYFQQKFASQGITDASYELFPLPDLKELPELLAKPDLYGLNVTIPWKQEVLAYVSEMEPAVVHIGAANVLKRLKNGSWKAFNSDYHGFLQALFLLKPPSAWNGTRALVFGTGGSSKAVVFALQTIGCEVKTVSRSPKNGSISYAELSPNELSASDLLVNCTPVGMHPDIQQSIPLPYEAIGKNQVCIDLIYNPEQTQFLKMAQERGATIQNGLPMLHAQAEKAWEIWNTD